MTVIDDRTANRNYQKPNADNKLVDDVARLRAWADAADIDMASARVDILLRAMAIHAHAIADVTGLDAALSTKVSVSLFSSLGASLVGASDAAAVRSILQLGSVSGVAQNGVSTDVLKGNGTWGKIVASMIGSGEVLNAKLAATVNTIKGSLTSGGVADLTPAQVKGLLAIAAADITDATANGRSLITASDFAAMRNLMGVSGRMELVASSANVAGASYIINNSTITKVYKAFKLYLFDLSHNSASSQQPQVSISGNNGVSWSTINCAQAYAASSTVRFCVDVLRADAAGNYNRPTMSNAMTAAGVPYGDSLLVDGAINALKIAHSGGANDAGVMYLFGMEAA